MKNRFFYVYGGLLLAAWGLAACGETSVLGSRQPPDELMVVDGPPLSLPPDFTLRPPRGGSDQEKAVRSQEKYEKQAETLLLTNGASKTEVPIMQPVAPVDSWLIEKAGGEGDPNIRKKLEKENSAIEREESKSWLTRQKEKVFGSEDEAEEREE